MSSTPPLSPIRAILTGGLAIGTLDILVPITFYGIRNGTSPVRIFQSVATGLLGKEAFTGGVPTALLGAACHFFIATMVFTTYFAASRRIPALKTHPFLCGPAYGIVVYLVMNFIVLPLSAAGMPKFAPVGVAVGLFAHLFAVGLTTGLIARRT